MNSEGRADVHRSVQARDAAKARVRSLTVTVTAASVVTAGALTLNLPGSANATAKPGDEKYVSKPAPATSAPATSAPSSSAPASSGLSSGSAPAPASGGGQVTSGGS
jgi:hypothetical protein